MPSEVTITTVAHVIQLSVAPVFLLTGVGTILNVITSRLSRIIDRFRTLEKKQEVANTGMSLVDEMRILAQRERVIYWAISLCTLSALLICVVIATLFVGYIMGVQLTGWIALLFILAMLALTGGLLSFLREIYIATRSIHRVGKQE